MTPWNVVVILFNTFYVLVGVTFLSKSLKVHKHQLNTVNSAITLNFKCSHSTHQNIQDATLVSLCILSVEPMLIATK